ncbi:PrpF domain-containing protein [Xanthomonas axonopodis]|uniref:PrpF domain-containing protein n=1 Tax=Xanthomonas axonopodis TaxID=53413 RepID=UPI003557700F
MKPEPRTIPAVYARGGTSRAVIFKKSDLPCDRETWKPIFQTVLGSPDPESKQLDGLGGGITSLSKIAVLSPSSRPDADVDYLFVQLEPMNGEMLLDANCGNISSVVGPFAVEEAWVETDDTGDAAVRIFNENTGKIIVSRFNVHDEPQARVAIAGVAGCAAPILLRFEDPEGSAGKGGFPSGARAQALTLSDGNVVQATLIDVNVPCAIVLAKDVGIVGDETYAALTENTAFVTLMKEVRVAGALAMRLCHTETEARTTLLNVPDVVVVSAPRNPGGHLTARFISCDRPHRAAPVTSSMALAAAFCIPGTIPASLLGSPVPGLVIIEHPSGTVEVAVELGGGDRVVATSTVRTARRIMQGQVLVP